ncbi:hypothetical protein QVD17_16182 [Tagetes erecta]|uniref:LOB domain-containing protein n=1 Tax=Tagetes erecta TaxID=13708 RepID=A0AAD8KUJ4_TARER|nr:hypothetical protein QVD17_16182 [Tagetes erecta]
MSCNGCRVLRKACNDNCALRPCLEPIQSPEAQAHATLFLSKFFGRSDFLNFISSAPSDHQRIALFQSLLYEAAGRRVNPVNGAMGLLSTGNWHVCEAAVQTVLAGGWPVSDGDGNGIQQEVDESSEGFQMTVVQPINVMIGDGDGAELVVRCRRSDGEEPKLLKLFE